MEIVNQMTALIENFGWWAFAIVGSTFLVVIPLNLFVKFIFKKTTSAAAERVRKLVSQLVVFGCAAGCLFLFCIIMNIEYTPEYILTNCIPIALVAMALWTAFKVLRDCGIKPLLAVLVRNGEIKKALQAVDLDESLKKIIYNKLCKEIENTDTSKAEAVIANESQLRTEAQQMVSGFVDVNNIGDAVDKIYSALKTVYGNKK